MGLLVFDGDVSVTVSGVEIRLTWRGEFTNDEVNALHAEAFGTRVFSSSEWNWVDLTLQHSLGWVTARSGDQLVGFVNVPWDGFVHAWVQDTMVATSHRHSGVGQRLIAEVVTGARSAGCEWLHADFDADLTPFYIDGCGFSPTSAGLMRLA